MMAYGKPADPCILIVDDEPEILISLADLLRRDFCILATTDPHEALATLKSRDDITIVISDQRMPLMTGTEFLARAAAIAPDAQRILLTAYSDIGAVIDAVNRGRITHYFAKPWDGAAFMEKLKMIAERQLLFQENQRLVDHMINAFAAMAGEQGNGHAAGNQYSRNNLTERNVRVSDIIYRANQQIERSQALLGILKFDVLRCLRCGQTITDVATPNLHRRDSDARPVSGFAYCHDCRRNLMEQQ